MITKLTYKRILLTIGIFIYGVITFFLIGNETFQEIKIQDLIFFIISFITAIITFLLLFIDKEEELDDITTGISIMAFTPGLNLVLFFFAIVLFFVFLIVEGNKYIKRRFVI
jgi:uncharacterized membrane protein YtjA (UPF0391 family)